MTHCNAEARDAYQAGLRSLHEGSWQPAHTHFAKAVTADPKCPEAHLRLCMTGLWRLPAEELQNVYRRALQLRDGLRRRDQLLLDAYRWLVRESPRQTVKFSDGVQRATEEFPHDAELLVWSAFFDKDLARGKKALELSIEIDPDYADAWQALAKFSYALGDVERAREAHDQCVRRSPNATDCLTTRGAESSAAGRCREALSDCKAIIARGDDSQSIYHYFLAQALVATGASFDVVEKTLQTHWKRLEDGIRDWDRPLERAALLSLRGEFEKARRELDTIADQPAFLAVKGRGLLLSNLELETGSPKAGAASARRVLEEAEALSEHMHNHHFTSQWRPILDSIARLDGGPSALDPSYWEDRRTRAGTTRQTPLLEWAMEHAVYARDKADADAALESLPTRPGRTVTQEQYAWAYAGRALLVAERHDEAVTMLNQAARVCRGLAYPFLLTRAHAWLGEALEGAGRPKEACKPYQVVLDRWGKATPRSITAERVRKRVAAIGCPAPGRR